MNSQSWQKIELLFSPVFARPPFYVDLILLRRSKWKDYCLKEGNFLSSYNHIKISLKWLQNYFIFTFKLRVIFTLLQESSGKLANKHFISESAESPKKKLTKRSHQPSLPEMFRPADVSNVVKVIINIIIIIRLPFFIIFL